MAKSPLASLLRKVHRDEEGSISLETVLIIGAVSIPVLIFVLKVAWPRITSYFESNFQQMEAGSDQIIDS